MYLYKLNIIGLIFLLGGCGLIKDRSGEYVNESAGRNLILPPGLDGSKIHPSYPIPLADNQTKLPANYVLPASPDTSTTPLDEQFKIQKLDNNVWLVIQEPPGKVWPLLQRFVTEKGLPIELEDAKKGILLTGSWANGKKSSLYANEVLSSSNKVLSPLMGNTIKSAKFKLAQGVKRTSSEIKLSLTFKNDLSAEESAKVEESILNNIIALFKQRDADHGFSFVANDLGSTSKIVMTNDGSGRHILKLSLDFDRAWTAVRTALALSDINIIDLDRSTGRLYIYYHKKEGKGWFYWLFPETVPNAKEFNAILRVDKKSDQKMEVIIDSIKDPLEKSDGNEILSLLLKNIT